MTGDSTLTWLHLSDMHMCPRRTGWDAPRVLGTLRKDLDHLANKHQLSPDLIFFTGDAAFGQLHDDLIDDQFIAAGRFLEEVRAICCVSKENVFLVPGNHDVDRAKISKADQEFYVCHRNLNGLRVATREGSSMALRELCRPKISRRNSSEY